MINAAKLKNPNKKSNINSQNSKSFSKNKLYIFFFLRQFNSGYFFLNHIFTRLSNKFIAFLNVLFIMFSIETVANLIMRTI